MNSKGIIKDVAYPAIDGIRFYAAFMVFLQHTIGGLVTQPLHIAEADYSPFSPSWAIRLWFYFGDGNHGVDIFFIISGFLMARIVLGAKHFSYAHFIGSRIRRIYPAFAVSLSVAALAGVALLGMPWEPMEFAKNLGFLNLMPSINHLAYNYVSWSLGVEFAFYLVIPAFVILSKFADRRIVSILALAAAVVVLNHVGGLAFRGIGLFIGAVIGTFNDAALRKLAKRTPLALIVCAYFACGIVKSVFVPQYLHYYFPFMAIASVLLIKIVWDDANILNRLFQSKPMRWLGTLSFSIYLFHTTIAALVVVYLTPQPISLLGIVWYFFAIAAATIAVSYASYVLIEQRYFRASPRALERNAPTAHAK